ncbi:MAG: biopolymer transporter ExbD [Bryobacteraceae bacterium]|jgi:biopolymer transport protein ExbD/biopolymer transport protein TolR
MKKFTAAPPVASINVTPMVDVMLVMLIIFMVITPMLSKGVSVDLVKTRNPVNMANAEKEDAIVVAITREGKTFLGTTPTKPEDLPPKVKDMLSSRLDKTTYVKADARASYKKVVDVVDNLRASGVDQLGLMTEAIDEKSRSAGQ